MIRSECHCGDPVPLVLEGEGDFSLTAIKEVRVTGEFLGLGHTVTRCQTEELRADCVSRRYRQLLISSCSCLPLHLSQGDRAEVLLLINVNC